MKNKMFIAGMILLSVSLLLMPSALNMKTEDMTAKCRNDCLDLNMTMLMISDELQCVCTGDTPEVRRYPWK